jgi:hypothetical protein
MVAFAAPSLVTGAAGMSLGWMVRMAASSRAL